MSTKFHARASDSKCGLFDLLPEDSSTYSVTLTSHDPLVSVIVPCYNGAAYLEEALQSALGQTYANVEVIVIDDGSTDESAQIAQRFPVRYLRQQNRGKSEARNHGVQVSRGAYIVFLDADDRLKPHAIESGLNAIRHHPECAFAVGDHVFIASDGSYLSRSSKTAHSGSHYEALLKSNFIEMISTVLFRRDIFNEVGGFNSTLTVAEDYDFYLRITRLHPVCSHYSVIAEYRKHEGNISRNSELMLTTTVQVLQFQAPYTNGSSGRRNAYLKGLRSWRKQYGRQLASELAAASSSPQMGQCWRKVRTLVEQYPQGLLLFLLLKVAPSLRERRFAPKRSFEVALAAKDSSARYAVSGSSTT